MLQRKTIKNTNKLNIHSKTFFLYICKIYRGLFFLPNLIKIKYKTNQRVPLFLDF